MEEEQNKPEVIGLNIPVVMAILGVILVTLKLMGSLDWSWNLVTISFAPVTLQIVASLFGAQTNLYIFLSIYLHD